MLGGYGGGRDLWRGWGVFLGVGAVCRGGVALSLLPGQPGRSGAVIPVSGKTLLLSFGGCYALMNAAARGRQTPERRILPVELALLGRELTLSALRDTGNTLTDPNTGCGVRIAGEKTLSPLLPPELPPCRGTPRAVPGAERLSALAPGCGWCPMPPWARNGVCSCVCGPTPRASTARRRS